MFIKLTRAKYRGENRTMAESCNPIRVNPLYIQTVEGCSITKSDLNKDFGETTILMQNSILFVQETPEEIDHLIAEACTEEIGRQRLAMETAKKIFFFKVPLSVKSAKDKKQKQCIDNMVREWIEDDIKKAFPHILSALKRVRESERI